MRAEVVQVPLGESEAELLITARLLQLLWIAVGEDKYRALLAQARAEQERGELRWPDAK